MTDKQTNTPLLIQTNTDKQFWHKQTNTPLLIQTNTDKQFWHTYNFDRQIHLCSYLFAIWARFHSLHLSVAFHIETSDLICCVNQMAGSNMKLAMGWDELMSSWVEAWFCMSDSQSFNQTKWFWLKVCDNNFHEPPCLSWLSWYLDNLKIEKK